MHYPPTIVHAQGILYKAAKEQPEAFARDGALPSSLDSQTAHIFLLAAFGARCWSLLLCATGTNPSEWPVLQWFPLPFRHIPARPTLAAI